MSDGTHSARFDRMERTDWIDMQRIHSERVLVAGAGALGNEVVKDLVLAGFRNITVADFDTVEESNLSRCVLFRGRHVGCKKAEAVCESAADLDLDCCIVPFVGRIQDMDISCFDVVIGCLDSISARLHLNSNSRFYRIPYIDGATDGFRGKMQVVMPTGPCMECMMNRTHINELHRTFSCDPSKNGPLPDPVVLSSGITTTSVIAAMCVREAIKITCRAEDKCVGGVSYYDGIQGTVEILDIKINSECPNHEGEKCRSI